MKKLLFPTFLSLVVQFHLSFADVDSNCRDLEKSVAEIGQRVESLTSQYKLARLNGDGNLQNIKAQLGKALTLQIELKKALAQCQAGE